MNEKNGEVWTEVVPYEVNLLCPECQKGYMIQDSSGIVLSTYPAQYLHKCNQCGYQTHYFEIYPTIRYKTKEEEESCTYWRAGQKEGEFCF